MDTQAPTLQDFVAGWELFSDPVVAAATAGVLLGFLSLYVVLRRIVFVSLVAAQTAALGVALGFYLDIHGHGLLSPGLLGLLCSVGFVLLWGTEWSPRRSSRDVGLAAAYALTGAIVVVLGSKITQESHDIQGLLFGTAVLVRASDRASLMLLAAMIALPHLLWFRGISFAALDPVTATVHRLPVKWLTGFVSLSLGLSIGLSARALGALPVFAFSTLPATTMLLFGAGPFATALGGALLGAMGGAGGYVLAFLHDWPVGATQAGTVAAAASLAWLARAIRRRAWARRSSRTKSR